MKTGLHKKLTYILKGIMVITALILIWIYCDAITYRTDGTAYTVLEECKFKPFKGDGCSWEPYKKWEGYGSED